MEYSRFVRTRTAAWDDFERRLRAAAARPDAVSFPDLEALALAYRHILHDHAAAAARFPRTGAARRLRELALSGTHWLQRDHEDRVPGLRAFFTRAFPLAVRAQKGALFAAAALFCTALLFGASLALAGRGTGLALLGPEAVEGLREGRLWTDSLVTTVPPAVSSSAIATNNMSVALMGWAGGAALGLGSLYVVVFNGLFLGAILATTVHYGLFGRLLEFVSAHGPLELTLIVVTSGAGLSMGRAMLAAEDRPRAAVLRGASRDALVVLIGCLPWFVVLGLVEAIVSPAPNIPWPIKAALGLALEGLFLAWAASPPAPARPA